MAAKSGGNTDRGGGTDRSGVYGNLPLDATEFPELSGANTEGSSKKRRRDGAAVPQPLGARYIIIKPFNTDKPITENPFRLASEIDKMAGKVLDVKRLKSGDILVRTQTSQQAADMLKFKQMPVSHTPIIVEDYGKLNQTRGKIFRYDFRTLSDQEILDGLKEQRVVSVYRQKQRGNQGELEDSGVFILTFDTTILPSFVYAGYARIKVTPYIPNPMRCGTCLQYGHTKKHCKSNQRICAKCES